MRTLLVGRAPTRKTKAPFFLLCYFVVLILSWCFRIALVVLHCSAVPVAVVAAVLLVALQAVALGVGVGGPHS